MVEAEAVGWVDQWAPWSVVQWVSAKVGGWVVPWVDEMVDKKAALTGYEMVVAMEDREVDLLAGKWDRNSDVH